jgi:DNA modification methylase
MTWIVRSAVRRGERCTQVSQQSISKVQDSIQLIQGNCLEELPRIKATEDKFIIVTDPPFNVGYHYNTYKDSMDNDAYYEMLGDVFQYAPFVVIHYPEEIYKIAFQVEEFPEKVVSWVYNSNTPKQHRDIAFFGVKPDFTKCGQPYKNPTDKRIAKRIAEGKTAKLYDWWEINQVKNVSKDKTAHPCQMPLEVMKRIIAILPDDYTIVDPFMGSGTTGVACKLLGRKFIGIDMDKSYVDIAEQRICDAIHTDVNVQIGTI